MAVTTEFERQWLEMQEKYGSGIDSGEVKSLDDNEVDETISLPAVKFEEPYRKGGNNVFVGFRHVPMNTFLQVVTTIANSIKSTWEAWFGTTADTGPRKLWNDFWGSSDQDPNGVRKQWSDLHSQATADHTQASSDHTASVAATNEASNVNAQLSGYTFIITNRQGQSSSVDIGFEIYRTYATVAAMNADAANVPQGKFVVIATTSATDPDNAKMYCKNSQGGFTFLTDLDQASAEAWADWLNNKKPLIEQATSDANTAASNANAKAGAAQTAADTANTAASNANTQANRAKDYNDHPWEIGSDGYIWVWNETTHQMVRTNKVVIEWNDMTAEQRQAIIDAMLEDIVFASVQTCEDIVDELI